jgi:arabinofuranosyltransferase
MLTRLDSSVLVVPFSVVAWFVVDRQLRGTGWRVRARHLLGVVLPAAVLVIAWLAWASAYYGSPFPNTLRAKAGGLTSLKFGAEYVLLFVLSYGLPILIPAIVMRGRALAGSIRWQVVLSVIGLWIAYVVVSGGDFMEFRFLVPILPLLACVIAFLVAQVGRTHRAVLMVVLLAFSLTHLRVDWWNWVSGFDELKQEVHGQEGQPGWIEAGRSLGELFPGGAGAPGQVVIGLQPAGAIPFASDLPAVDILGLNDRWIAEHGTRIDRRPGHLVRAPLPYLVERRVNLLVESPMFVQRDERRCYGVNDLVRMSVDEVTDWRRLPAGTQVLEVPVGDKFSLVTVLLRSNERIDDVVAAGKARLVPIC